MTWIFDEIIFGWLCAYEVYNEQLLNHHFLRRLHRYAIFAFHSFFMECSVAFGTTIILSLCKKVRLLKKSKNTQSIHFFQRVIVIQSTACTDVLNIISDIISKNYIPVLLRRFCIYFRKWSDKPYTTVYKL